MRRSIARFGEGGKTSLPSEEARAERRAPPCRLPGTRRESRLRLRSLPSRWPQSGGTRPPGAFPSPPTRPEVAFHPSSPRKSLSLILSKSPSRQVFFIALVNQAAAFAAGNSITAAPSAPDEGDHHRRAKRGGGRPPLRGSFFRRRRTAPHSSMRTSLPWASRPSARRRRPGARDASCWR